MRARIMRGLAAAMVAAFGFVLMASAASVAGADTTTISVDDNFFRPKKVTVEVGDKVTWKWVGFVAHNVTVEKGPQKFRSKTQSEGKYSKVIKKPGVYQIVCTLHAGMKMKLTAVPAPPPTTVPPTTAPPVTVPAAASAP